MNDKYVSLIIPVYNAEKYLPHLFVSILKQEYPFFEVVFVNDGSKDDSLKLIEVFCNNNPKKFRYISKENGGLNPARKTGLDNAQYDLIMFSDSDDYFDADYISNLVRYIDLGDIVCAPIITEDETGKLISVLNETTEPVIIWNKGEALENLLCNFKVGNFLPSKLFKRELFANVDFSYNKPFEDYTVSHLIFDNALNVVKINKPSYHYLKRKGTLSSKTKESFFSSIDALLMRKNWVFDHYPDNRKYTNLIDLAIMDRFIQIINDYYIPKKNKYYNIVKEIYMIEKKNNGLNQYCINNIPLYLKTPRIYFVLKRLIALFKRKK